MYYDNFVQVKYVISTDPFIESKGIAFQNYILDYEGFCTNISDYTEDQITELEWNDLYDTEDVIKMFHDNNIEFAT